MTFKTDEQLRKYLKKKVEYGIRKDRWEFNGIKFRLTADYFSGDFWCCVIYTCDFNELNVTIERTHRNPLISETFKGSNAISESIGWVVDKLVEIYTLLNERIAPYIKDKVLYDMAISSAIELKE